MTITQLRALSTKDALEACAKLDAAARQKLFIDCPATDHRILLVIKSVENLVMSDGFASGITGIVPGMSRTNGTGGDYGAVRTFILKQLGLTANSKKATAAKTECWKHWFFPEYSSIRSARERFARIAEDHTGLKAYDPMQVPLFSLNGFFNFNEASTSSHTFTTCALFVRACRAAAHLLEVKKWATNTPSGTDACIVGPSPASAAIPHATRGKREPKRGDIFHVMTPGKNNAHVGVILSHRSDAAGNWIWRTAEGGQGTGYSTLLVEQHVLKLNAQGQHMLGTRPVIKWIDLDLLAASLPRVS